MPPLPVRPYRSAALPRQILMSTGARALAASLGGGLDAPRCRRRRRSRSIYCLTLVDRPDACCETMAPACGPTLTAGSGLEGLPPDRCRSRAVAADYDNDGQDDLFVMRFGGSSLYHNDGRGYFTDVTRAGRTAAAYPYLPGAAALCRRRSTMAISTWSSPGSPTSLRPGAPGARRGRTSLIFPRQFAPAPLQLLRNNRDGTFTGTSHARRVSIIPVTPSPSCPPILTIIAISIC